MDKGFKKFVTFSYDDGITQDKRLVEIFNKYGVKCTFNLNSALIGQEGSWEFKGKEVKRMTSSQMKEVYKGHEIACHFCTHPFPFELTDEQLDYEIGQDVKTLSQMFGCEIVGGAYPYGQYDDRVVEALKRHGIRYYRTVDSSLNFEPQTDLLRFKATCHHNDERLFELAEEFINASTDKPLIFYVWGHSYEFDGDGNWDRIERLCSMLSCRSDIYFGTNAEILLQLGKNDD